MSADPITFVVRGVCWFQGHQDEILFWCDVSIETRLFGGYDYPPVSPQPQLHMVISANHRTAVQIQLSSLVSCSLPFVISVGTGVL